MNRKNGKKTSAAAFLLVLLAACEMTVPELEPVPGRGGKAEVRVSIEPAGIPGRTVAPSAGLDTVTTWALRGGQAGETETQLTEFSSAGGATLTLDPGTWSFTLEGRAEAGVVVLGGTIPSQTINAEGINTLEFTVAPVLEGQGSLSIVISLPEGSGISGAEVFKDGVDLETPVTPANNQLIFTGSYPAGDYYFSFRLYNGADLYGVVSELIQIRGNLESGKTYTLTQDDLNYIYVITYHLGDTNTETGYYRYTDGAITLPAPSTSPPGQGFAGWYEYADFSGSAVATLPRESRGDKNFYAKWLGQHTVIFDADGGTPGEQSITVIGRGSAIGEGNMPPFPTKREYVFGGWYTERNGGGRELIATTSINEDVRVYAKWTLVQYTVTFNADGGSPDGTLLVDSGAQVGAGNMPSAAKRGYTFGDWYTERNGGGSPFTDTTVISGDITVYAKWTFIPMPGDLSLADSLAWLNTKAADGRNYTITLTSPVETIGPQTLSYDGGTVGLTITGGGSEGTISLSSSGSLFTVESGVTLTLENNVTLTGRGSNYYPLVWVNSGGTLEMKSGSKISGNNNTASRYYHTGGVYVASNATFNMSGGTISGNTAYYYGGGVYVDGSFIMSGGTISDNTVSSSSSSRCGGGVYVASGTFIMRGGIIEDNTAYAGGGVYVGSNGSFTKQLGGGIIYGSNADLNEPNVATGGGSYGHAVYVYSGSKKRNTTVGADTELASGSQSGWE